MLTTVLLYYGVHYPLFSLTCCLLTCCSRAYAHAPLRLHDVLTTVLRYYGVHYPLFSLTCCLLTRCSRAYAHAPLRLHNVTLVVPLPAYAALLAAALRVVAALGPPGGGGGGGGGPPGAWRVAALTTTAPLMAGISALQLDPAAPPSQRAPALALALYTGWGVHATRVRFEPEQPLPLDFQLPDFDASLLLDPRHQPPAPSPDGPPTAGGSGNSNVARGVGLGVGLGGAALLATALGFLVWKHHFGRGSPGEHCTPAKLLAAGSALGRAGSRASLCKALTGGAASQKSGTSRVTLVGCAGGKE